MDNSALLAQLPSSDSSCPRSHSYVTSGVSYYSINKARNFCISDRSSSTKSGTVNLQLRLQICPSWIALFQFAQCAEAPFYGADNAHRLSSLLSTREHKIGKQRDFQSEQA